MGNAKQPRSLAHVLAYLTSWFVGIPLSIGLCTCWRVKNFEVLGATHIFPKNADLIVTKEVMQDIKCTAHQLSTVRI